MKISKLLILLMTVAGIVSCKTARQPLPVGICGLHHRNYPAHSITLDSVSFHFFDCWEPVLPINDTVYVADTCVYVKPQPRDFWYNDEFENNIKSAIQNHLDYHDIDIEERRQGNVTVSFVISDNGQLLYDSKKIEQSFSKYSGEQGRRLIHLIPQKWWRGVCETTWSNNTYTTISPCNVKITIYLKFEIFE